jgi:hypothetical protein
MAPWHLQKTLRNSDYELLIKAIELYDSNRPINHIPKIELIKGDALETIPKYFKENNYVLVALLYLDFDFYEATKVALETIIPRMPKGSIVAFDELNDKRRPGETAAMLETMNLRDLEICQFPYEPHISWVRL